LSQVEFAFLTRPVAGEIAGAVHPVQDAIGIDAVVVDQRAAGELAPREDVTRVAVDLAFERDPLVPRPRVGQRHPVGPVTLRHAEGVVGTQHVGVARQVDAGREQRVDLEHDVEAVA